MCPNLEWKRESFCKQNSTVSKQQFKRKETYIRELKIANQIYSICITCKQNSRLFLSFIICHYAVNLQRVNLNCIDAYAYRSEGYKTMNVFLLANTKPTHTVKIF